MSGNSSAAVIIDPGIDAAETVRQAVREHRLHPVAVLCTHGHLDHVANAAQVGADYQIPVWIHSADRHLLSDPVAGLGLDSAPLVQEICPEGLTEPADVRVFDELPLTSYGDSWRLNCAGLEFTLAHAPGHSPGCVLLSVPYRGEVGGVTQLTFSGDVLFAGSIGRTDLPGGDMAVMRESLNGPVLALPDSAAILPGHGPQTTMAAQRANNPYLQPGFLGSEY